MVGGQSQAGVFAEVVDGLYQALAKGGFADDQGAIMVLKRAGNDLRRRSRVSVYQYDDGKVFAVVAVGGGIDLIGIGAAALGNDGCPFQQMVANFNGLTQQTAGVIAQIKDQPFKLPKLLRPQ